ncbi:hypothetical protein FSP39_001565 [Pinctada imbricata]|uniref:Uncharacterized protein n=1 Tax=Pinctada imbricata TaxID=66713 RepID=A0AA88Y9U3_PINIB|nr:hypothetical protein FSP39_001565 [Pinctada imbricata]
MSYRIVEKCPEDENSWTSRSRTFMCKRAGQRYHCMMSSLNSLVELCHKPRALDATDGCPILEIVNRRFHIKSVKCLYENKVCPDLSRWTDIFTHQMYKYPDCIISQLQDKNNRFLMLVLLICFSLKIGANESTEVTTPFYISRGIEDIGFTEPGYTNRKKGKSKKPKHRNRHKKKNQIEGGGGVGVILFLGLGAMFCVLFKRIKIVRNQVESVRYERSVRRDDDNGSAYTTVGTLRTEAEPTYMELSTYDQISDVTRERPKSQQYITVGTLESSDSRRNSGYLEMSPRQLPEISEISGSRRNSDYLEPVSMETAEGLKNRQYIEIIK